ncbi:rolling circle replication-associated protein [Halanaerobium kushneri]|uniref:Replication-associated protein ORF2/G2P domain-containing protein n=1 Tax=Halanaerobium kushneri TaxID=56779 RepID=A0A1N7BZN5_9FIRM|nr:hypothetical protein [Halanaerobium kushneri]SIR56772.1 hypothetical protein SAMN05421834_13719 [Halanaerobium kushneri]
MIQTAEIKKLKNKDLSFTEVLEEINTDFNPNYDESVVVAGSYVEIKKYADSIFKGNSKTNKKTPENKDALNSPSKKKSGYTRSEGISRANRIRKNKIKYTSRANADDLNKFVTLDFGTKDYFSLITGDSKSNCEHELSRAELEKLRGIKDLTTCNDNHPEKLNENEDDFREKAVEILTKKSDTIRSEVDKYVKENYSKNRYKTEFNREIPRRLNSLISNCDPNDLTEAKKEFAAFSKRIRESWPTLFKGSDFKYFAVIDIQKGTRHFHFHLIANFNDIPQAELQKLWNNGTVTISKIYKSGNIFYFNKDSNINKSESKLTHYMTKKIEQNSKDPRCKGKQMTIPSNGLKRFHKITNSTLITMIYKYFKRYSIEPKWSNDIKSEKAYGKDFQISKFELPDFELFEDIETISERIIETLLELNKEEITREDYYNAMYEIVHSQSRQKAS